MNFHQNSTPADGIFKGLDALQTESPELTFNALEQQAISALFWECMITELNEIIDEDPRGDLLVGEGRFRLATGVLNLGDFYAAVIDLFEQHLPERGSFSARKIKGILLRARLAFMTDCKLMFEDSSSGNIICYGNLLKPVGLVLDLHALIERSYRKFCSFI